MRMQMLLILIPLILIRSFPSLSSLAWQVQRDADIMQHLKEEGVSSEGFKAVVLYDCWEARPEAGVHECIHGYGSLSFFRHGIEHLPYPQQPLDQPRRLLLPLPLDTDVGYGKGKGGKSSGKGGSGSGSSRSGVAPGVSVSGEEVVGQDGWPVSEPLSALGLYVMPVRKGGMKERIDWGKPIRDCW